MSPRLLRLAVAVLPAFILVFVATPAFAAWPHGSTENEPVAVAANYQEAPVAVSDGAGGVIIAWMDQRSGTYDVYAQRYDATGKALWNGNGTLVAGGTGGQEYPTICPDLAGGAIIVWHDSRAGWDIYAQRMNASGVPQWTANGVVVCNAPSTQQWPQIVSDGYGGATMVWQDNRTGNYEICAQRLNASGVAQWTANGVSICTSTGAQEYPQIDADGLGGFVFVWQDNRGGVWDIYGQRATSAGMVQWGASGAAICTADQNQFYPYVTGDGLGGGIFVWFDYRSGTNYDIYAQRLDSGGSSRWLVNGVAICDQTSDQYSPRIVADGSGGAIIAWDDARSAAGYYDIYAQHVDGGGLAYWTADGMAICNASYNQRGAALAPDGAGGAFVAWDDTRRGNEDIYVQHVDGGGEVQWQSNGVAVCTALNDQFLPVVVADGAGGLVAAWTDMRNSQYTDVYAQGVTARPGIAAVRDVPNDQGGRVRLSWDASFLDTDYPSTVDQYLVWRQVPAAVALARGPRAALATTIEAGLTYYWEVLDTVTAAGLAGYSYVAATTGDSVAGSNPRTHFMVRARNSYSSHYWDSRPDSGYSVDNLAPAAPAPFTGQYALGSVALHWGGNAEADFALYRLYRGTTPGFVPGAGNLVTAQPDTGFVDHAGAPFYYKLCAVDAHGNVSPYAFLAPDGVLAADGSGAPAALWLARPAPNPARDGCVIRFGLPRAATVRLAIFDQQGRRVRELIHATLPAGEHAPRWDGRDQDGREVASGLYFARVDAEAKSITRKLAVAR